MNGSRTAWSMMLSLQTTAPVHQAYLTYVGLFDSAERQFTGTVHFLAVASRVTRQVLVDYAWARATNKRAGSGHDTPERVA